MRDSLDPLPELELEPGATNITFGLKYCCYQRTSEKCMHSSAVRSAEQESDRSEAQRSIERFSPGSAILVTSQAIRCDQPGKVDRTTASQANW